MVMCWVPLCKHYNIKHPCKFYSIPKDNKLRRKWLKLIRRNDQPSSASRVCSCHFRDGCKKNMPEIFPWNKDKLFKLYFETDNVGRRRRNPEPKPFEEVMLRRCSSIIIQHNPFAEAMLNPMMELESNSMLIAETNANQEEEVPKPFNQVMLNPVTQRYRYLPTEDGEMQEIIPYTQCYTQNVPFSYNNIRGNERSVFLHTGLPAYNFEIIAKMLEKQLMIAVVVDIPRIDQLLLTLMKLRQNCDNDDLALMFAISPSCTLRIILCIMRWLHKTFFEPLRVSTNSSCLIMDCIEVPSAIVGAKGPSTARETPPTFNPYTHRMTWKGLIGVSPEGMIIFSSTLMPGNNSDRRIAEKSKIYEKLLPDGHSIMIDKGFLIKDLLPPDEMKRRKNPSTAQKKIVVERVVRAMKGFKILEYMPRILLSYSSVAFQTVAALVNLQIPLQRNKA